MTNIVETDALRAVRELLSYDTAQFIPFGITPPRTLLLSGPPGVGKTRAVGYVAEEQNIPLQVVVPGPNSCERVAAAFKTAQLVVKGKSSKRAAIVLIDEIDDICPSPSSHVSPPPLPSPTVALLAALLDTPSTTRRDSNLVGNVGVDIFVIATTNRPAAVHSALRRAGRLDRHVVLAPPSAETRLACLKSLVPNVNDGALRAAADAAVGFVVADLSAVVTAAKTHEEATGTLVEDGLLAAVRTTTPSILRTSLAPRVPYTSWNDIAGATIAKRRLMATVEWPLRHANTCARLGVAPPRGVLLHGPPGCAKTSLVRAAASAARVPFLRLTAADIYSAFIGDSERIVREAFATARAAAPCILFLDELDAVAARRDAAVSVADGNRVQARVLAALLTEMDGVTPATGVLVSAATNRIDLIDDALLRPGRFDDIIHIDLPNSQERRDILHHYSKSLPLHPDVNIDLLAAQTQGRSGADLKGICTEAALAAMREHIIGEDESKIVVKMVHFAPG